MLTNSLELPQKSLQIKPRGKYSSRRSLSKEISVSSSSTMEDYHGGLSAAVSVPFSWESQPGTPKVRYYETSLPPLTPPPSYCSNSNKKGLTKKHSSKSALLLNSIFPKLATRKTSNLPSSPALSTSSSSSSSWSSSSPRPKSYSVPSSPITQSKFRARYNYRMSSPRLSFDSRVGGDDDEETEYEVPSSPFCFGRGGINLSSKGCYSSLMKVFVRDLS